jgi:MYXO-CTERM domain-containing protein
VFHAHVNQDDDRCGGTDRQRTEIRARAADIVANNGETVYYRWKFKLDAKFQGSSRFTHIFQIKSDLGAPIMTLTPRVSTFGITGRAAGSSSNTDLAKFRGVWVVVDLKVLYSDSGRVEITIRKLSDGQMLYAHAGGADMWDANASAHDSKFGIYRSLDERQLLRDEQVLFADFCASKVNARECDDGVVPAAPDGGGGGTMDAGAAADAGGGGGAGGAGGAGGSAGTGGSTGGSGSGGSSGAGGSGGGSSGAGGSSSGSSGGSGAGGGTPTTPDASTGTARDTRPNTGSQTPTQPQQPGAGPATGGCSLVATNGGRDTGWAAGLLLALGFSVMHRRRRRRP